VFWNIVEDISVNRCNDNILENKFVQCLRRRVRPVMLTRPGYDVPRKVRLILEMNPDSAALGCAETAAFGGGGGFLIGKNPQLSSVQRQFREFVDDHPALFAGLDSFAQVGVAFFSQHTYFGDKRHFVEVRRVTRQLLDGTSSSIISSKTNSPPWP